MVIFLGPLGCCLLIRSAKLSLGSVPGRNNERFRGEIEIIFRKQNRKHNECKG